MKAISFPFSSLSESPPFEGGTIHRFLSFFIGFSPFLSIAATNFFFFAFILVLAADLFRRKTSLRFHRTPFDFVLLTYLFVWGVASLNGLSPMGSLAKGSSFQYPFIFYMFLFSYQGKLIPWAVFGLGCGAGVNVVYGWGQFVLWHWVYDISSGVYPEWVMGLGEKWRTYITLSPGQGRIHGAFHLMTYSELLLPPFLLLGAMCLEKWKPLLLSAGFILTGAALIFAAERGPFFGALIGIILIYCFHPQRWRLFLPLVVLAFLFWFNPTLKSRLMGPSVPVVKNSIQPFTGGKNLQTDLTGEGGVRERADRLFKNQACNIKNNHRVILWRGGLYIAARHWLLGVGPGQIGKATDLYREKDDFPSNPEGQERDLHSFYIQSLVEMGLLGLMVSLWMMIVFYKVGRTFYRTCQTLPRNLASVDHDSFRALSLGIWGTFLAYGIINLTERAFDDAEVSIVFWILAATAVWFTRQVLKMKERGS